MRCRAWYPSASKRTSVNDRTGLSGGDRNRNARLARLRQLLPLANAIVGIDPSAVLRELTRRWVRRLVMEGAGPCLSRPGAPRSASVPAVLAGQDRLGAGSVAGALAGAEWPDGRAAGARARRGWRLRAAGASRRPPGGALAAAGSVAVSAQ